MNPWINLMATLEGWREARKSTSLQRGMIACSLAAPLLLAGCAKLEEESYKVADGQKSVPFVLEADHYQWTFYGLRGPIELQLRAPEGTTFAANGQKTYALPLDIGQKQNVYFTVQSDGSLIDGKPAVARNITVDAEGYARSDARMQQGEKYIWSKAPNNKPYTPRLLAVQYYYGLGKQQRDMVLNMGTLRRDPYSQFNVQGAEPHPRLVLRAAAGQAFVFSPDATTFQPGDKVPRNITYANEYVLQMAPGQEQALTFWMAENGHLRSQRVAVSYALTP